MLKILFLKGQTPKNLAPILHIFMKIHNCHKEQRYFFCPKTTCMQLLLLLLIPYLLKILFLKFKYLKTWPPQKFWPDKHPKFINKLWVFVIFQPKIMTWNMTNTKSLLTNFVCLSYFNQNFWPEIWQTPKFHLTKS